MEKTGGLKRRPNWKVGVEKDNENQKLIKEEWICNLEEIVIDVHEVNILEKIKIARGKDEEVIRVVKEMQKKAGVKLFCIERKKYIC